MARLIQQINHLRIMKRTKRDPYYRPDGNTNYLVKTPDGRIWEDRLTLYEARAFCRRTKDFRKKPKLLDRRFKKFQKGKVLIVDRKNGQI